MNFAISADYELIRRLLTEPRCYARMISDDAPTSQEFQVSDIPGVRYVIGSIGAEPLAVFLLIGSKSKAAVHFCIQPAAWGLGVDIGKDFLDWAWTNTKLIWLEAPVPTYNRLALKTALMVGFQPHGIERNKGTKHGHPFDLAWLRLDRPKEHTV